MFTLTFRFRKKVAMVVLCGLVAAMAGMITFSSWNTQTVSAFSRWGKKGSPATTNQERLDFITTCGVEVEETPVSQVEVVIPPQFDAIYVGYNQIQKSQGFDLEKYRGKTVSKYSYIVKATQGQDPEQVVSLLVYQGRVIGADLCSREMGGILKALRDFAPTKE